MASSALRASRAAALMGGALLFAGGLAALPAGSRAQRADAEELRSEPVAAESLAAAAASWRSRQEGRLRAEPRIFAEAPRPGALAGRRLAISAGHGTRPNAGIWSFQRDILDDLREDIHTNQMAIEFLVPLLERAGAEVVAVRERSLRSPERVVDNDDPAAYLEGGSWNTSASPGFEGGSYRYAYLHPEGSAFARWTFDVPEPGEYPVYAYFLSSANRSRAAAYRILHHGGESQRILDQGALRDQGGAAAEANARWHYLGSFPFAPGEGGVVELSNLGADPDQVVVADALRVGADESGVTIGGIPSGLPRWQEGAIVHLEAIGAPSWVLTNDVTSRSLFAIYDGVDAYFALHTDCCGGSGSSTYTWYPDMWIPESSWPAGWAASNLPPGTYELSDAIHQGVIAAIRTRWQSDWPDRGHLGANFGEIRPQREVWAADVAAGSSRPLTIPSVLLEAAFHSGGDTMLIREAGWRHDVSRAIANGMIRHFAASANAEVPPLAPEALVADTSEDALSLRWQPAADPVEAHSAPTGYRIYRSDDGVLFSTIPALETTSLSAQLPLALCEAAYLRVTAFNGAGESLPGPTLMARRAPAGTPRVLWIHGVDREVRTIRDPMTPRDYARLLGPAIQRAASGHGYYASATDEAVGEGLVSLADYDAVIWSVGETSRRRGSLDAAQRQAIADYVATGSARLLLSGAELGWDLIDAPADGSETFLPSVLGADYLADYAPSSVVEPEPSGPFAGIASFEFGSCTSDTYCVESPDVYGPSAGSGGQIVLR
ncbi:MAG: hypothetical protein OEY14_05150, partial [Myxococcales bacterium]|nr:hypothetical protein [Myxococcales bacterium]